MPYPTATHGERAAPLRDGPLPLPVPHQGRMEGESPPPRRRPGVHADDPAGNGFARQPRLEGVLAAARGVTDPEVFTQS